MALRDTLRKWADGPWLYPTSALIGLLEASFVLVPVEPLLIPLMASKSARAWGVAAALVAGNLVAAVLMYWLGANLAETAIDPFVRMLGAETAYQDALTALRADGFWALLLIDLTPIPFQVAMAAAGAALFPFGSFLLAVLISRGLRWFAVAGLVQLVGARAHRWIESHQVELLIAGAALFIAIGAIMWLL